MRNLYIVDPSLDVTGALVSASREARALMGVVNTFIVLPIRANIPEHISREFTDVIRLPISLPSKRGRDILFVIPELISSSWRLARILRTTPGATLQLNDFYLIHGALSRLFLYRGPIVTWVRAYPSRFGVWYSRLALFVAAMISKRIVAVSYHTASGFPKSIRAEVIYEPDGSEGKEMTRNTTLMEGRRTIAYVANYVPGKGHMQALNVFRAVADEFPDSVLSFHGSDMGLDKNRGLREELSRTASLLGLDHRVRISERTDDARQIFKDSYAAMNLSLSESFSLTCLEAGSVGTPIVVTDCGGPREIVDDGVTGFLVPVQDEAAAIEALQKLLRDPNLADRMGRRAKAHVSQKFGPDRQKVALLALFGADGC